MKFRMYLTPLTPKCKHIDLYAIFEKENIFDETVNYECKTCYSLQLYLCSSKENDLLIQHTMTSKF